MKKLLTLLAFFFSIVGIKAQCSVSFMYSPSPANDGNVYFWDSTNVANPSYAWNFNGTMYYGNNPVFQFPTSGSYPVCVTVTDSANNCSASFCDTINVTVNGTTGCYADFTIYNDSLGLTYFSNQSAGNNLYYTWDFGDGSVSHFSGSPSHTYAGPGIYYVCLTVSNSLIPCTDTRCDTVLIASCSASFSHIFDSIGTSATFTPIVSAVTDTYYWSFGDGSSSTLSNPTHTYSANGYYTVQLSTSSTTDSACFASSTSYVYVTGYCDASFYTYSDSTQSATSYMFVAQYPSQNSSTTYYWSFGDGTSTSGNTSTVYHTYANPGNYSAYMYVTSSWCSDTSSANVFISSCSAMFTYTFDPAGNGCSFNSSAGTADTYLWDFGDGTTSAQANPYHVFANNGAFYVQLTTSSTSDSTCINTHSEYVYASGNCDASFNIYQDSTNVNSFLVYCNSTGNANTTYLWDFGDGTTSTLQYPTHTYATSSAYYLCLTVTNANGCSDTHCDTLNPGHGSGQLTVTILPLITTSVSEEALITTTLGSYPNPFNGSTTISYSVSGDANIELYVMDLLGNRVSTIETDRIPAGSYTKIYNAETLASGMYLLQMKINNDLVTKKIVITK
jgi:PKD repeat protein